MEWKSNLDSLKTPDIYSILLFVLYRLKDTKEYSTLSELAYLLDKDSLLNLCEYYGGLTITIPTIKELSNVFNALLLYEQVNIKKGNYEKVLKTFDVMQAERAQIVDAYQQILKVLDDYEIST